MATIITIVIRESVTTATTYQLSLFISLLVFDFVKLFSNREGNKLDDTFLFFHDFCLTSIRKRREKNQLQSLSRKFLFKLNVPASYSPLLSRILLEPMLIASWTTFCSNSHSVVDTRSRHLLLLQLPLLLLLPLLWLLTLTVANRKAQL